VCRAAARAADAVSAMATRACRPRAASVQTTVRTSAASPPKKPAVPVTSRWMHSGGSAAVADGTLRDGGSGASRPHVGENRRHQRAT
jgi:acyl-coenzyme A thioesterase PaaI-like protein